MAKPSTAITRHRLRLRNRGLRRIEVVVGSADVPLVRSVASLLRGTTEEAAQVRQLLRQAAALKEPKPSFKDLLAAAPLEGIDLERSAETSRDIEF